NHIALSQSRFRCCGFGKDSHRLSPLWNTLKLRTERGECDTPRVSAQTSRREDGVVGRNLGTSDVSTKEVSVVTPGDGVDYLGQVGRTETLVAHVKVAE